MIDIILHEPEFCGNIGAVCRAMKNFGFLNLIVVGPSCEVFSEEAKRRSKHAIDVLENTTIKEDLNFLSEYNYVIGTTAITGTDYNIKRSPISLRKFIDFLKVRKKDGLDLFSGKNKVAILFGSEGSGLRIKELEQCDYVVSIDSHKDYRTLNLSHAVSIFLYELFQANSDRKTDGNVEFADRKTRERIYSLFNDIIVANYKTDSKIKVLQESSEKVFSKGLITKRESFALMGLLKKLKSLSNKSIKKN